MGADKSHKKTIFNFRAEQQMDPKIGTTIDHVFNYEQWLEQSYEQWLEQS